MFSAIKMLPGVLPVLLLAVYTSAAPTDNALTANDKITIDQSFFPDELALYTAEHDIVSLFVPLNELNFEDDGEEDESNVEDSGYLFFALADIADNGEKTDQGLYVMHNRVATKLLDNGRDSAADNGDNKLVYFGAKDGLYVYNEKENKADKYGSITDSIINLVKVNGSDVLYILTEDNHVYKVTDQGNAKEEINQLNGARKLVLDTSNNLYYLDNNLVPYVTNFETVKPISGLPDRCTYGELIRPAFVLEDTALYACDSSLYNIFANGTSELTDFILEIKPTAYAMDATLIHYYAYNKKIYEYNILALVFTGLIEELRSLLDGKKNEIQSIASRSRSDLRA